MNSQEFGEQSPKARRNASHRPVLCRAAAEAEVLDDEVSANEEKLDNGRKRLDVTIPADKVLKAWQRAIKLEGRTHDFPGFRQGKKVGSVMRFGRHRESQGRLM